MTRRRILILFLTFLAALSGAVYFVLHGTGAARSLVRQKIEEAIRGDLFRLDDAKIDLTAGVITVTKFSISHPKPESQQSPLVSVDKIELSVETNPLSGVGIPRHIVLDGLKLNLTKGQIPELSQILQVAGVASSKEVMDLPSITVTNAEIEFRIAADRPTISFSHLEVKLVPMEASPDEFEINGTMRSQLGHVVTIRGGGNAKTGELRTLLTMANIPIKPVQAAAYQKEAAEYLEAAGVSGTIKQATLWLDVRDEKGPDGEKDEQRVQLGLNAQLVDLAAAPIDFPYQLRGATARLHGTLGQGGAVKIRIENKSEDGDIIATGRITRLLPQDGVDAVHPLIDFQLDVNKLRIGSRLRKAFAQSRIEAVKSFEAALAPTAGRISAKVRAFNKTPGAPLEVQADVSLEDLAARFHGMAASSGRRIGFPYPVHDVNGKVFIRQDAVIIEGLTAKDADGAALSVDGEINLVDGDVRPNLDIRGTNVRFSKSLRDSLAVLAKAGAEAYDEYAPVGTSNILVKLRDVGRGTDYSIEVRPNEASGAYYDFPYRIHALDGLVKITNEGVWIDIKGVSDKTPVTVHGRFLLEPEHGTSGVQSELWVKSTGLLLDPKLFAACRKFSPELAKRWDDVQPTGVVDCEFTMWKEVADEEFSYDVHVHVTKSTAELRACPVPITNLKGDLFVYGTGPDFRLDISPLRGEITNNPDARLFLQGSVGFTGGSLNADLTTIVRNLRLTPEIGPAVERAGLATNEAWREMHLDGHLDITAHHRQSPTQTEMQHHVGIRLRDVSSRAGILPGVARDLHGQIEITGNEATFKLIEGEIDETGVTLRSGTIGSRGEDTVIRFVIDSESIPVDKRLANLLGGPSSTTFFGSDIGGRVGLTDFVLEFRIPKKGPLGIRFQGDVTAHDLFVDVGLPGEHSLQHINGTATLTGTIDDRGGRLSGTLKNASLQLTRQRISAITTRFDIDPERLTLHDLEIHLAGGVVKGIGPENLALEYRFDEAGGRLRTFLLFTELKLNDLLRDRGLGHSKLRGLLSGIINIRELRGANFLDMRADGEIGVNNGRLGRVPIFSALYSHIAEDKRPQFTQAYAKFGVEHQRITLSNIRARSTEIKIEGQGTLDMDGYMDVNLRMPGLFGRAADILILPPLIDWGVSKVVSFQLYGYIRAPKLSWSYNKEKGRTSIAPIGPAPRRPAANRPAKTR
jgi:hypothetical protein